MKYRDLQLFFSLDKASFSVLSMCLEKLTVPIPKHSHSKDSYELHYISYGYGTLITPEGRFSIVPGSLFMTGPGMEHEQISFSDNPMTEYCIYFRLVSPISEAGEMIRSFLQQIFWFGEDDQTIHALMKQLFAELEERSLGYEIALQSLLSMIVLKMFRNYKKFEQLPISHTVGANPADLTYLTIEEAFLYDYQEITLVSLANKINLSARQTERLLRLHYKKTFQQKKTEARMSAACMKLRENKDSVSKIAQDLGYSSVEHFSGSFRRYFQMTPSAYKKSSIRKEPDTHETVR